jgi:hypothetical protein
MKHPHTGEEMVRALRVCPVPGFDLSFGDCVVWNGQAWVINSMHYREAITMRPVASLVRYGDYASQPAVAYAPLEELKVFRDAELWTTA